MPIPFEIEAAFHPSPDGLQFLRYDDAPHDWSLFCELRVHFRCNAAYAAEPDVGAGLTWDGDIEAIEIRRWGKSNFLTDVGRRVDLQPYHWAALEREAFTNARAFLLRWYGAELWQAGDQHAANIHYGVAA